MTEVDSTFVQYDKTLDIILKKLRNIKYDVLDTIITECEKNNISIDDFTYYLNTQEYVKGRFQKMLHDRDMFVYLDSKVNYY